VTDLKVGHCIAGLKSGTYIKPPRGTTKSASVLRTISTPSSSGIAETLGLRRFGWRCRRRGSWRRRCVRWRWRWCDGGGRRGVSARWGRYARSLRACGAARERKQRDVAGALDGFAEPALVAGANAGHAARENLASLLHELREDVGALVVDEVHLLDAELADFLFAEILALTAARAARPTAGTSGAAFTARTAVTAARAAVSTAGTVSATSGTAGSG
jgi:hypothetical protein